jgi:spermidine synthase
MDEFHEFLRAVGLREGAAQVNPVYRLGMVDVVTEVDERREGAATYRLERRGSRWDIAVDGQLVMSTAGPRIETEIADLAITPWGARDDLTVLVAGLGMGLLVRALLDRPHIRHVDVVEISATISAWAAGPLAPLNGGALGDKRVRVLAREACAYLREPDADTGARPGGWSILALDTDDWPRLLSRPENVDFYHEEGLVVLETSLRPGGVFVTHTSRRDDELEARLRQRFQSVARVAVPVEDHGESKVHYVYRGRRSGVGGGEG